MALAPPWHPAPPPPSPHPLRTLLLLTPAALAGSPSSSADVLTAVARLLRGAGAAAAGVRGGGAKCEFAYTLCADGAGGASGAAAGAAWDAVAGV